MRKRKTVKVCARAKINLSLNISGKDPNGMHLLDSVTASVSLADAVTVHERENAKLMLKYSGRKGAYENDTVLKAVASFRKIFGTIGFDISVEKKLPVGGGVGGSSADAAATLYALDKLYGIFSKGYMLSDAASVGSDVPVMLRGGYNRLFGTGERFDSFDAPTLYGILLYGDPGVSTKECYALFDKMYEGGAYSPADNDALVAAMKSGDIDGIAAQCKNALFLPACELCPIVGERTAALDSIGAAAAFMTGSGSACFGLFGSEDEAADACKEMKAKFPSLGEAEVVSTVPSGVTENRDTLAAYRKLLGVPPKKPTFDF